jgi:FkbM family methyltransferase
MDTLQYDHETASPASQLNRLLNENPFDARTRSETAFDKMVAPYDGRVVLFGAGSLGRRAATLLREVGRSPQAFADNNREIWGRTIDGLPVVSPEEASHRFGDNAAFLVSVFSPGPSYRAIHRQLTALGCRSVISCIPFLWRYADQFLPYYLVGRPDQLLEHKEDVQAGLSLWADEESRREYVAQVGLRLWGDFESLAIPRPTEQYFPHGLFSLNELEQFVDCGAFQGDTLQEFLSHCRSQFDRYIGFEPDPANFASLKTRIAALPPGVARRATAMCNAVGAKATTLRFSATGTGAASVSDGGENEVQCVALDDVLCDWHVTYIKMDVEGAEGDALQGARATIQRDRPILAVSAYHRPHDLWCIPRLLHSLSKDYLLFLRSHYEFTDLVCYAVPSHRLATN